MPQGDKNVHPYRSSNLRPSGYRSDAHHYENLPIQIYWKFYHQQMKIFK